MIDERCVLVLFFVSVRVQNIALLFKEVVFFGIDDLVEIIEKVVFVFAEVLVTNVIAIHV